MITKLGGTSRYMSSTTLEFSNRSKPIAGTIFKIRVLWQILTLGVQIPESTFFQNFYSKNTCVFTMWNKDDRPSSRSIRCIWQDILDFEFFSFTCNFSTKVGYRGFKSRGRPFSNLLHCGSLSIPNTTGESPTRMGGTVLNLGASGHWLDYVIHDS